MTAALVIGVVGVDGVGDGFGVIFFTFFTLTLLAFGLRIRLIRVGTGDVAAGFVVGNLFAGSSLSKLK